MKDNVELNKPNIFEFATKELSQDAMICWLVACADHPDEALRRCGRAFVGALFRAGLPDRAKKVQVVDGEDSVAHHDGPGNVEGLLGPPQKQYRHIDIYFRAKIDGKTISFIVEDKVRTTAHGDQLIEYRKQISGDDVQEDCIKPIYFKTGYVFEEERRYVEKCKYSIFDLFMLADFLRCQDQAAKQSEILHQYQTYILGEKARRKTSLRSLAEHEEGDSEKFLREDVTQYQFMLGLRGKLINNPKWVELVDPGLLDFGSEWKSADETGYYGLRPHGWSKKDVGQNGWTSLLHGASRGGGPFTQLYFCKRFFWRVDPDRPLRLMLWDDAKDRELWGQCREAFCDALKGSQLTAGEVRFRFGRECTIGAVRFDRSYEEITDLVPGLQAEFLRRIREARAVFSG